MNISIAIIIIGVALLAKHQFEILRFRYKQAEICPAKIFPTGPQSCRLTNLEKKRPQRPTMFIPLLACRIKRPLFSEIAGIIIIFGGLYWAWNYSVDFPLIFSVAIVGVSWIYITKYMLILMLKLCDYPTVKLVVIAIMIYPTLLMVFYCLLWLMNYLDICKFPFKS